jgi:5-methylcytosine-specific restriction endonuclease McrA
LVRHYKVFFALLFYGTFASKIELTMNNAALAIKNALISLGGVGTLTQIYGRCPQYSEPYIRKSIQQHSSDTLTFPKLEDLFFSVDGLGNGIWGLRNYFIPDAIIQPNNEDSVIEPQRQLTTYDRILRDTVLVREIKKMVGYKCQLCDLKLQLPNGGFYIEGHHIKPLGRPYNGPDKKENIIILCPNCHTKCDYRLIELSLEKIKNNIQNINQEYIDFHNIDYRVRII